MMAAWLTALWLVGGALILWRGRAMRWPRVLAWSLMCVAWWMLWPKPSSDPSTVASSTLHVHTDAQANAPQRTGRQVWLPEAQRQGAQEAQAPDFGTAKRWFAATAPDAKVHLHGHGLSERDRSQTATDATTLSLHALHGWRRLHAPARVFLGQPWVVSGEWVNEAKPTTTLTAVLTAPDGRDVTSVPIESGQPWSMEVLPPVAGMHTHHLHIKQGEQTRSSLPLAVFVQPPEPIRVALVMATPSPEWKFLQRYLSDTQSLHSVSAQFTPTMHGQQSWGRAATQPDVVIMAWRQWLRLDDAAQRMWLARVTQEGLGLLFYLQHTPNEASHKQLHDLGLLAQNPQPSKAKNIQWRHQKVASGHSKQPMAWPLTWAKNTRPVRVPHLASSVGAWRTEGQGRLGILAVADTWRWPMWGDSALHQRFWANVIAEISQPSETQPLRVQPAQGREGTRHWVCGAATVAVAYQGKHSNTRMISGEQKQPSAEAGKHCHSWFPRQSGWHQITVLDESSKEKYSQWHHVHPADWAEGLNANQRWQHTQTWHSTIANTTNTKPTRSINTIQIPEHAKQWPWVLLWLLAAFSLWWFERWV